MPELVLFMPFSTRLQRMIENVVRLLCTGRLKETKQISLSFPKNFHRRQTLFLHLKERLKIHIFRGPESLSRHSWKLQLQKGKDLRTKICRHQRIKQSHDTAETITSPLGRETLNWRANVRGRHVLRHASRWNLHSLTSSVQKWRRLVINLQPR